MPAEKEKSGSELANEIMDKIEVEAMLPDAPNKPQDNPGGPYFIQAPKKLMDEVLRAQKDLAPLQQIFGQLDEQVLNAEKILIDAKPGWIKSHDRIVDIQNRINEKIISAGEAKEGFGDGKFVFKLNLGTGYIEAYPAPQK